jgi:hypothetical protein
VFFARRVDAGRVRPTGRRRETDPGRRTTESAWALRIGRNGFAVDRESILREHGLPHYLKIDIEGHDRICLDSLRPDQCPRYLSSELTHGNGLIDRLHTLGYRRFKLINQATYTEASPIFDRPCARLAIGSSLR